MPNSDRERTREPPEVIVHPSQSPRGDSPPGEVGANALPHFPFRPSSARSTPPLLRDSRSPSGSRMSTQEIRRHLVPPFQSSWNPDPSPGVDQQRGGIYQEYRQQQTPSGDRPEVEDDDGHAIQAPNQPVSTPRSSRTLPPRGPDGRFLKARRKL